MTPTTSQPTAPDEEGQPLPLERPPFSRARSFGRVTSTQEIVRRWLAAGLPEVALAVAESQTTGRGRGGRQWVDRPGGALLLSLGFRPRSLPGHQIWRLAAIVSLAMADAAEDVAGLRLGTIRLKWPNDLVVEWRGPRAPIPAEASAEEARAILAGPVELRKLGGVLAEATGVETGDPQLVVGIGVNTDWPPDAFPRELASTMTSLRQVSGGRPISNEALLASFADHLEVRLEALRSGYFDVAGWLERQVTTGREVEVVLPEGQLRGRAVGLDPLTGALVVAEATGVERRILSGEVVRVRLAQGEAAALHRSADLGPGEGGADPGRAHGWPAIGGPRAAPRL
jgi:BirA family biotin operon repressor/biotin-[acetyl-CoA-carboxylase] ligase